jgi:5-hydroxyisourate hydrolase-like protein (transthyretin family)
MNFYFITVAVNEVFEKISNWTKEEKTKGIGKIGNLYCKQAGIFFIKRNYKVSLRTKSHFKITKIRNNEKVFLHAIALPFSRKSTSTED